MDKYQTFGRRVGAAILDMILLAIVNMIVGGFLMPAGDEISYIVTGVVTLAYHILLHYYYGQSLGKMATKVKVVDAASETPIHFGQAVLRYLPELLPVMFAVSFSTADDNSSAVLWQNRLSILTILFVIVDVVVCLANEKRRALHDFIAGTVVVRTDI